MSTGSTGFTHTRKSHTCVALILASAFVTVVATGPALAQGSASDLRAGYLADFDTMQTKFQELAGAMDADTYGWRPMDGVRSVSEVFMLIAAENYFVPSAWGATPPDGITPSFGLFEKLAGVTDKRDVLAALETSATYAISTLFSINTMKNVKNLISASACPQAD